MSKVNIAKIAKDVGICSENLVSISESLISISEKVATVATVSYTHLTLPTIA